MHARTIRDCPGAVVQPLSLEGLSCFNQLCDVSAALGAALLAHAGVHRRKLRRARRHLRRCRQSTVTLIRQPVTSRAQTTEGIEDEDLP